MIERFTYDPVAAYPDKATVIFYKNGPSVEFNAAGDAEISKHSPEETPYYMEAEINSPMAVLGPGQTYAFDTNWFPSRLSPEFTTVTEAGLVGKPLAAHRAAGKITLSGSFGVFFPGELQAFLYDDGGRQQRQVTLEAVRPQDPITLHQTIAAAGNVNRVSIHLIDSSGVDRGALGEVFVTINEEGH